MTATGQKLLQKSNVNGDPDNAETEKIELSNNIGYV